jgi:hypothetical protein
MKLETDCAKSYGGQNMSNEFKKKKFKCGLI